MSIICTGGDTGALKIAFGPLMSLFRRFTEGGDRGTVI
jgi:hypothetical protein